MSEAISVTGAAPARHRNVRCAQCGAVQWVATDVSAIACEQCGEAITFAVR